MSIMFHDPAPVTGYSTEWQKAHDEAVVRAEAASAVLRAQPPRPLIPAGVGAQIAECICDACRAALPSWRTVAAKIWPKAISIDGEGAFALVDCHAWHIRLYLTAERAHEERRMWRQGHAWYSGGACRIPRDTCVGDVGHRIYRIGA